MKLKPKRIPIARATGGESSPLKERRNARKKIVFESKRITGEKSMKAAMSLGNREIGKGGGIHPHFYRVLRTEIIAVLLAAKTQDFSAVWKPAVASGKSPLGQGQLEGAKLLQLFYPRRLC